MRCCTERTGQQFMLYTVKGAHESPGPAAFFFSDKLNAFPDDLHKLTKSQILHLLESYSLTGLAGESFELRT